LSRVTAALASKKTIDVASPIAALNDASLAATAPMLQIAVNAITTPSGI
jgi:hypothetical protein